MELPPWATAFLDKITGEGHVIKEAPVLFATTLAIGCFIIWFFTSKYYSDYYRDNLSRKDDLIASLEKLSSRAEVRIQKR